VSKKKSLEIDSSDYAKLLSEIRQQIAQTQNKIIASITRQKVEMAWQVGKLVEQHLSKNSNSAYGKHLFESLESDLGIAQRILYQMRNFYQTYPKLPKDDQSLNWSHYRTLAGLKKIDERKHFEDLAKENGWSGQQLQQEVSKKKMFKTIANKAAKVGDKKTSAALKKLTPLRGQLFSYPILQLKNSPNFFFDCGFGIFKEVPKGLARQALQKNEIVAVAKEVSGKKAALDKKFPAKKIELHPKKLYAFKADLDYVVDGDTIRVVLDLGFGIFHKEILRLRGINAAEIETAAGKKSKNFLAKTLQNAEFLIVKTTKTDTYGRYVADVFLAPKSGATFDELEPQKVADEGIYLNQLLLDEGFATPF
jgi:endonuclease YncB( thermonuclease family)